MKKHVFVWTGTRDKGIIVIKYVAQAMVLLKGLLGITQHSIRERIIQESVQIYCNRLNLTFPKTRRFNVLDHLVLRVQRKKGNDWKVKKTNAVFRAFFNWARGLREVVGGREVLLMC